MAQLMDDGLVMICDLINTAEAGDMPVYSLSELFTQYYAEQSIGLTRSYLAKGVDERVDMVIRIAFEGHRPRIGQYAMLTYYDGQENENGDQFRIDLVQPNTDEDGLKCFDLTLYRLEDNYDTVDN